MRAHPVTGAVVFFVMSAISALIAFASSVVLVPPANEVFGKPVTFLLLWGGWIAGAIRRFFIGYFSRSLLHRLVSREQLAKYEALVSKRMKVWAATLLCLAVPSEIPGYLFGALHYPFWKFLVAISIAEAIYAIAIVIAGESLTEAKPATMLLLSARAPRWSRVACCGGAGRACLRTQRKPRQVARYFSVSRYAAMSRASRSVTPRFGIAPSGIDGVRRLQPADHVVAVFGIIPARSRGARCP